MSATQTGLLERLQARSEALTLPEQLAPCHLVSWVKHAGDTVERFEALAIVEQDQVATTITATHSGRLRGLAVQDGELIQPNQVLCYIEMPTPRSSVYQRPHRAKPPKPLNKPDPDPPVASQSKLEVDDEVDRRPAILPSVEQMVRERAEQRATTTISTPRKKPRTKAKVYRVTPDQVQQVKHLVQEVRAHVHAPTGPPISESELVRAGLELLTSLSLEAVLAIVDENREREQVGKYGAGWPRPGRHRRRKKSPEPGVRDTMCRGRLHVIYPPPT